MATPAKLGWPSGEPEVFDHPALFYRDPDQYVVEAVTFIRAGLTSGEPVLVAVPEPNLHHIGAALGTDAGHVSLLDMATVGRNPGRILPGVLLAFASAHRGRRVRIIGEPVWPGRTALEYPACGQHEALINAAFIGRPATILCPYDAAGLDPLALETALLTHPVTISAHGRLSNPRYRGALAAADHFNRPLPEPPARATTMSVGAGGLSQVRAFARLHGEAYGLATARLDDFVLAVNEIAANTIEHAFGPGVLAVWREDDGVICQLTDPGRMASPMAGRLPVAPDDAEAGRGLLLVNHLCDLVRIYSVPDATTVRLHMLV
jgi:anti-sigma regulatory factor (Ser/Thr protein kinase)